MKDLAQGFGERGPAVEFEFFDGFGSKVFVEIWSGDGGEWLLCGEWVWCGGESCPAGGAQSGVGEITA